MRWIQSFIFAACFSSMSMCLLLLSMSNQHAQESALKMMMFAKTCNCKHSDPCMPLQQSKFDPTRAKVGCASSGSKKGVCQETPQALAGRAQSAVAMQSDSHQFWSQIVLTSCSCKQSMTFFFTCSHFSIANLKEA